MKKLSIILSIFMFQIVTVFAQDTLNTVQKLSEDTLNTVQNFEKIIITASKYDVVEKNAPVLVSIINKNVAENLDIRDLGDLGARVPNLFMQRHGTRLTSPIYIRGIGSRINSPAVGLYVDGIPYFDLGSMNFDMYGISRIEVLRGPQGTLYGRNTMGGLINVITDEPINKTQFSSSIYYGNYNHLKFNLHFNQAISKNLIFVIDALRDQGDGYFTNTFLNKSADNFGLCSGRFKLKYKPSSKFQVNFVLNYERNREYGYPYALYDTTNQTIGDISYDQASSYFRNLMSMGLKLKYTASKFILQSSTSYQSIVDTQRIDQDFTPLNLLFVNQNRVLSSIVEELSIKSKPESKIKWIAGVFGFQNTTTKNVDVYYNEDAVTVFHLPTTMTKFKNYVLPEKGIAEYGQITIPIFKFNVTAGIRADYEIDNLQYKYNLLMGTTETPKDQVDTFNTYMQILPKFSISYRINTNAMVYTSFAKGYKAGGFNSTFERPEDISFDPEFSYNYEFGLKSSMFDNKFLLNTSVFYIDWLHQQVYQPVPSGHGAMLKNAGHSMSRGGELELRYIPFKNFQTWFAGGYNDVKYLSYVKDETTDYSGNIIPYIPEYTGNIGLSYSFKLNKKFLKSINFMADYQYIGKLYWNDQNTAYQNSYGLLNANLVFSTKHFDFGFIGKNILNENYNAFYFEELGSSYAQRGNPMDLLGFLKIKF